MCLLTNERYKTYQTGNSFGLLGHAPGVGLGGTVGVGGDFFSPKFNQIWCVSYLHECHKQWHHFLGPGPLGAWGEAERSNIIKSELQVNFKDFKPNFVHLLTNERYITYQAGFSFAPLDHARGGIWWYCGGLGVNFFLSKIQPDWMCELFT